MRFATKDLEEAPNPFDEAMLTWIKLDLFKLIHRQY